MKALIIGSNGYIGRHLILFLQQQNIETHYCDLQTQSVDNLPNYQSIDITQTQQLAQLDFKVDFIFLLSGLNGTKVGFEHYEKYITVNEIGLLNVLNQMKETQSKARVVFLSSRLVYKGVKDMPLKEDAEKEFKTIYAVNKFACENYLKMHQHTFGINYTIFRLCVPYGNCIDEAYSYGTIGFMLGRALKKENIPLYGGGLQKRTFSHVEDVCQLIIKAINKQETQNNIYNLGSSDALSLAAVAKLIAHKYEVAVTSSEWPAIDLAIESGDTIFDGSKLEKLLNYQYKHDVATWLNNI